jgi:phage/conjugal plasmid C-4 type zinc finger TraR family protein
VERETVEREPGDEADRAEVREAEMREDGIAEVRARVQHGDWQALSAKWCDRCGERVPDARRAAVVGVRLCVECQAEVEAEKRTRGW